MDNKKYQSDYDGSIPEINLHSDIIQYLKKNNLKYKAWGSSGPDLYLEEYDIIGEVKKSLKQTKSALNEIFARPETNRFSIKNFNHFFIIGNEGAYLYKRIKKSIEVENEKEAFNIENPIVFQKQEMSYFFEYIQNNFKKIKADNHLEYILDVLLSDDLELTISDILTIILHMNDDYVITNKFIVFNPGSKDEVYIETQKKADSLFLEHNLLSKYYIEDITTIKEYIKHNFSSHMPDYKKANFGKYYTPKKFVEAIKDMVCNFIKNDTYIMDLSCGCGAFLELFEDTHIIGRDIDKQAIEVLDCLGFVNVEIDNSLYNVSRGKYNLSENDDIVIVGNPPYNDTTAKNKRYGLSIKSKDKSVTDSINIDMNIKSKDLGRSFLRAYAKLNPTYICVIHPLSYLIKKVNFNDLKEFKDKYVLKDALVFSSSEFNDLKGNTEFPICIALYERGSMDYEFICKYKFKLLDRDYFLCLNDLETIDNNNYIRKYPKKTTIDGISRIEKSDINLYMYNIRDINSLISGSNFQSNIDTTNVNYISVNYNELYKYCYLYCMKTLFESDYVTGNLSPLVKRDELENSQYLKDLFVITAILKNQRLDTFNIKNKNSILYTKFLDNDFKKRNKEFDNDDVNIYDIYLKIKNSSNTEENKLLLKILEDRVKVYFNDLKKYMFKI